MHRRRRHRGEHRAARTHRDDARAEDQLLRLAGERASVTRASRPAISGRSSAAYRACSAARTIPERSAHGSGSRNAKPVPIGCRGPGTVPWSHAVEPVRFVTDDRVSLEGELRLPEGMPRGSAVICHAHPRHGGSKDHPILWAVRNELAQRGFAVLAFNFRGTMGSAGTYGGGRAEVRDLSAAIGRVREEADGPTVVCGWSFGANVALRGALDDERVERPGAHRAPAAPRPGHPAGPVAGRAPALRRPVLLLSGETDAYSPEDDLRSLASSLPLAEVVVLPGTDHYLWRHEKAAAGHVGSFAEGLLEAPGLS